MNSFEQLGPREKHSNEGDAAILLHLSWKGFALTSPTSGCSSSLTPSSSSWRNRVTLSLCVCVCGRKAQISPNNLCRSSSTNERASNGTHSTSLTTRSERVESKRVGFSILSGSQDAVDMLQAKAQRWKVPEISSSAAFFFPSTQQGTGVFAILDEECAGGLGAERPSAERGRGEAAPRLAGPSRLSGGSPGLRPGLQQQADQATSRPWWGKVAP